MLDWLAALGSWVSGLLGTPHTLSSLLRGKGVKSIEFYPPSGMSPGAVTQALRRQAGAVAWSWRGYLPTQQTSADQPTRRPACITVSRRQARWVELALLDMDATIITPLEDSRLPLWAAQARARGGLHFWRVRGKTAETRRASRLATFFEPERSRR